MYYVLRYNLCCIFVLLNTFSKNVSFLILKYARVFLPVILLHISICSLICLIISNLVFNQTFLFFLDLNLTFIVTQSRHCSLKYYTIKTSSLFSICYAIIFSVCFYCFCCDAITDRFRCGL